MLTQRTTILCTAALPLCLLTSCSSLEQAKTDTTLAMVGDARITEQDVRRILEVDGHTPVRFVGPSDPFLYAVEEAIEDELLLQAAENRNIDGQSKGQKITRLLASEHIDDNHLGAVWDPSTASVKEGYVDNAEYFAEILSAEVSYLRLSDTRLLEEFLSQPNFDVEDFEDFGADHAHATFGDGSIGGPGGTPAMVARIANASKRDGSVGYDYDSVSGTWWVVLLQDVELTTTAWSFATEKRVSAAMLWEAQQAKVENFSDGLRIHWPVEISQGNVHAFSSQLRDEKP